MSQSAGAADKEMDIITNSLEYKLNALKETATGIWQNIFNREDLGAITDFGTGFLSVLDNITEKLGLFGTAIAAGGIVTGVLGLSNALKSFSAASGALTLVEALGNAFPGLSAAISAFSTAMATTGGAAGVLHGALSGLWALIAAHPIIAAVGAVALLAVAFDKLHESAKEANEKMENSFQAYEDAKQKVEDVNTELQNVQTSMEALEQKGSLTFIEQKQLDDLREASELLKIQKDLAEKEEEKAAKQAAKDAVNAYQKNFKNAINEEAYQEAKQYSEWSGNNAALFDDETDIASYIAGIEQIKKLRDEQEKGSEQWNKFNDIVSEGSDVVWEQVNALTGYKEALESIPVELRTTEQNDVLKEIDQSIEFAYSKLDPAKWKQIQFDSIFSHKAFNQAKQDMIDVALASKNLGVSINDVKETLGEDLYGKLDKELTSKGFSMQDFVDNINSTAEIVDIDRVKDNIKKNVETVTEEATGDIETVEPEVDVEPKVTVKNNADEKAKFDEWVDSLSDDYALALQNLMKDQNIDTSSWDTAAYQEYIDSLMQTTTESAEEASKVVGKTIDEIVSEYQTGFSKIQTILKDQSTGKSISASDYSSDELKDYTSALEYHNGVLRYNAEKVNEIAKAKAEETKQNIASQKALKQSDYLANARQIEEYRKQLTTATGDEKTAIEANIASLLHQNSEIAATCNQYNLMISSINEATSAYQNWLNAQGAAQSGDMFDSSLSALKKVKEVLTDTSSKNYLKTGNEDYKSAIDFIIPENIDSDDQESIKSYINSIKDYLTFDKDGNADGLNVQNFFDKSVEAGLMTLDEATGEYKIAGQKTMKDFADGLGLSLPLVQAIFGELEEYNWQFDWSDEAQKTFGDLAVEANEAAEALRQIEGNEDLRIVLDVTQFEDKETAIKTLGETINEMNELKAKPDVDVSEVEQANTVIQYCVAQKQMLEAPAVMHVDTSVVSGEVGHALELLQQFQQTQNTIEIQASVGADTSEAEAQVDSLTEEIQGLSPEVKAQLSIDDSSKETITNSIQKLTTPQIIEAGVDTSALGENKDATIKYGVDSSAPDNYKPLDKDATVKYNLDSSIVDSYNPQNLSRTVTYNIVTVGSPPSGGSVGVQALNGTAHASGTALASGNWGKAVGGKTLVGELGTEIIVDPHTGRWYTVGDNGAEFVNVPKNAIVFNHLQSEALLDRGYVYDRGTALVSGNAAVSISKQGNIPTSSSSSSSSGSTDSSSSSGRSSSSSSSKSSSESSENKSFKDWISNLFDWAEIRLNRLNRLTEKWSNKAEQAVRYSYNELTSDSKISRQYDKAEKYTLKAIKAIGNEITGRNKAKNTYTDQLEKIRTKGGLDSATIKKIKDQTKNGTFDIETFSSDSTQKEAINQYKTYYEKVLDCKDAVDELKESQLDLYTKLYNLPIDKANAKLEKYENTLTRINSISSTVSGGSRIYFEQAVSDAEDLLSSADNSVSSAVAKQNDSKAKISDIKKKIRKTKSASKKKSLKKQLKEERSNYSKYKAATKAAKASQEAAYSSYSEISSLRDRFEDAPDFEYQNYLLDEQLSIYEQENRKTQEALRKTTANRIKAETSQRSANQSVSSKASSIINKYRKSLSSKQLKALEKGNAVSTKGVKDKKELKALNDYNKLVKAAKNAATGYTAAQEAESKALQNATEKQTAYTQSIQDNAKAKLENIQTYYENSQNAISSQLSTLSSQLSMFAATGVSQIGDEQRNVMEQQLSKNQQLLKSKQSELADLEKALNENRSNMSNTDILKAESNIESVKQGIYETTVSVREMQEAIDNIEVKRLSIGLDKLKTQADELQDAIDIKESHGLYATANDYQKLVDNSKEQVAILEQQNAEYRKQQTNLDENSEKYIELQSKINSNNDSIRAAQKSTNDWYRTMAQLPFDTLERAIDLLETIANYNKALADLKVAKGIDLTEGDILQQISDINKTLEKISEERKDAYDNWQKALASSDNTEGMQNAEYWEKLYYKLGTDMIRAQKEQVELNNKISEIPINKLEKVVDLLGSMVSYQNSLYEIQATKGIELNEQDYIDRISKASEQINAYNDLANTYRSYWQNATNDRSGSFAGKSADEWLKLYYDTETSLNGIVNQQVQWRNEIGNLPLNRLQKSADLLSAIAANAKSIQNLKVAEGFSLTESDYREQMSNTNSMISNQEQIMDEYYKRYRKALSSHDGTDGAGKSSNELLQLYMEASTEVNNLKKEQIELNNSIAQLPYETIQKYLNLLDAIAEKNKSEADYKQALGIDLSESDYRQQILDAENKIAKERALMDQSYNDYLSALSNGGAYGGKSSDEYLQLYNEYAAKVNEIKTSIEGIRKSMRDDVFWRTFTRAHQEAKNLSNVLKGIDELITNDMMYDKNNKLTSFGLSHIANITKEYETARKEVQNYSNDINNLNKLYGQGYYSETEYKEKLDDLQKSLLDSANNMKGYIENLKDAFKESDQKELDSLYKLIDARNKALSSKKAYYDYDKTIRNKTKDIKELTAQIAALEGINTSEAKAQMAKLKADLAKAQEDLEDTEKEHYFTLAKDSLDNLKTTLQEEFDDKWSNLGMDIEKMIQLLDKSNTLAESNASTVASSINELLKFYGVNNTHLGIDKVFASGTKRVGSSLVGLSNEKGNELLVTKHGIISRFDPDDGVVPSDLTERLYQLAKHIDPRLLSSPASFMNEHSTKGGNTEIIQNYDSLINIEGSADAATVEDLKKLSKDILEKAYDYTSNRINKDRVRTGGLRNV